VHYAKEINVHKIKVSTKLAAGDIFLFNFLIFISFQIQKEKKSDFVLKWLFVVFLII